MGWKWWKYCLILQTLFCCQIKICKNVTQFIQWNYVVRIKVSWCIVAGRHLECFFKKRLFVTDAQIDQWNAGLHAEEVGFAMLAIQSEALEGLVAVWMTMVHIGIQMRHAWLYQKRHLHIGATTCVYLYQVFSYYSLYDHFGTFCDH